MLKRIISGIAGKCLDFGYLALIKELALQFNLTGTVSIKDDGSVQVIAEGEEEKLEEFVETLEIEGRDFFAERTNFYVDWEKAKGEFEDFSIIPTPRH